MSYVKELKEHYADVHNKFFPPASIESVQRRTEAELLGKIHELQIAYVSVANRLSTDETTIKDLTKRIDFLEELVKPEFLDENNPPTKIITINAVLQVVCKHEGIQKQHIVSARRTRDITYVRMLVYYLAATLTYCSLPQIGRMIGGRDHTTILHGRNKVARLRQSSRELDAKLTWYETALKGKKDGD